MVENIEIFQTSDGSPTASHALFNHEKMHHTGGALLESVYVYSPVIKWALQKNLRPQFLSLGLGLGYLELLVASYMILENGSFHKSLANNFYLESFEADLTLTTNFLTGCKAEAQPLFMTKF